MGIKGDKHTSDAQASADLILGLLKGLEGITSKKMFGGHGIFHEARMFGMVSFKGEIFFKVDDYIEKDFSDLGCAKHSKMPYYTIPEKIIDD